MKYEQTEDEEENSLSRFTFALPFDQLTELELESELKNIGLPWADSLSLSALFRCYKCSRLLGMSN